MALSNGLTKIIKTMAKELHITATLPATIQSCKQDFSVSYPKYGGGSIELTPYGDYILTTYGMTEGSAKRTSEYKAAYSKVSLDMLHAYQEASNAYTSIHKRMMEVLPLSKYKQELESLTPQKYQRSTFALAKPTKNDIEEELRKEVQHINFNTSDTTTSVEEKTFIKEHLTHTIEERQQAWQEGYDLFCKIENAKEAKENAKYYAAYKNLYNQKAEYIQGKQAVVEKELSAICTSLHIPYNATLTCNYNQSMGLVEAGVILEDGINIPATKATILSSGKISIKNKLVKEMISDKSNSAVSLVYYLSNQLFLASPNVLYVRMALYDRSKQYPLLWVEFDRERFAQTRTDTVNVLSDILGYPNVTNLKTKGDAIELATMTEASFMDSIKTICGKGNSNNNEL